MPPKVDSFSLDLVGVIYLFGGNVALAAIHNCVFEKRIIWSIYLSPGMYAVAQKLLKRTENTLAKALSPGPRDVCRDVVGLMETGRFFYVGLLSGTRTKVANPFGEAVLNVSKNEGEMSGPKTGREVTRHTRVNIIEVDLPKDPQKSAERIEPIGRNPINIIIDIVPPIITLGVFIYLIIEKSYFGAAIIIIGAFTNMLITYAACASGCRYMPGKPAEGSPLGHSIVKDELSPDQLWIVLGNEESVQRLIQRPVIVELNKFWHSVNLIAGIFAYVYTAFSILALPSIETFEQLLIGGLLIVGLIANIMYARREGDKMLSEIAKRDMQAKCNKGIIFTNRTAAIAYCILRCKSTGEHTQDFLPNTKLWNQWRALLTYLSENQDKEKFDLDLSMQTWHDENNPEIKKDEEKLWKRLTADIEEAFYWIREPHVVINQ